MLTTQTSTAKTDTAYVRSYYRNLVPRLITNYKNTTAVFETGKDSMLVTDNFSTGGQNYIGAELSYRWATIGYNFGFNKENSTTNTDLKFATSYKPFRLQANLSSLRNLSYYHLDGKNQQDTLLNTRQHNIELVNVSLKVDYVLNYKQFYYPSSVANAGQQLKSKGSLILSTGISLQDFDLRGLADSAGIFFVNRYGANHFTTTRIDLGVGYAYNWVISRRWALYACDIPNLGYQKITTYHDLKTVDNSAISITNYIRAGIVYTWDNKFIGAYAYNSVSASQWSTFSYSNVYTSLQLHIGIALRDPKRYFPRYRDR